MILICLVLIYGKTGGILRVLSGYMPLPPSPPEPTTGNVSGTVFFNDGATALPNAEVKIFDTAGNPVYDNVSTDGTFSADLPAGDYSVCAIMDGVNITVNGDNNVFNFTVVVGQNNTVTVATSRKNIQS